MRDDEIRVGKVYTNGKGKLRKVVNFIDDYSGLATTLIRIEEDFTRFDVLYTHEQEGSWEGRTGRMWLPNFARWAKSEVKEGEDG